MSLGLATNNTAEVAAITPAVCLCRSQQLSCVATKRLKNAYEPGTRNWNGAFVSSSEVSVNIKGRKKSPKCAWVQLDRTNEALNRAVDVLYRRAWP